MTGMAMIARRTTGLAIALALALGGCVKLGGGGKPPASLLTLTAAHPAAPGAIGVAKPGEVLVVAEPEAERRLAVSRVPVASGTAAVSYLKGAVWVERPARLVRDLLAETLRARGGHLVLVDEDAAGRSGTVLSGRLLDLGYDAGARRVIARYDAVLSRGGTLTAHRFEASVDGVRPDVREVGPALNQAANDLAGQVADWVGSG